MNPTLDLILAHRSIRQFTAEPITDIQLDQILSAAQAASSSSFLQANSIIRVTDKALRSRLAELAGHQAYVAQAAEFLLFCADYHRHCEVVPDAQTGFVEQLLIGAIDGALMAQNALLAAQSMGLGGVYIGGIRNNPAAVSEAVGLPHQVIPLFGLCLGHPAQAPEQKPRLPRALVVRFLVLVEVFLVLLFGAASLAVAARITAVSVFFIVGIKKLLALKKIKGYLFYFENSIV